MKHKYHILLLTGIVILLATTLTAQAVEPDYIHLTTWKYVPFIITGWAFIIIALGKIIK